MLVNASAFPIIALWQGVMMCVIPVLLVGMFHKDGKYIWQSVGGYVFFGFVLFLWLTWIYGNIHK